MYTGPFVVYKFFPLSIAQFVPKIYSHTHVVAKLPWEMGNFCHLQICGGVFIRLRRSYFCRMLFLSAESVPYGPIYGVRVKCERVEDEYNPAILQFHFRFRLYRRSCFRRRLRTTPITQSVAKLVRWSTWMKKKTFNRVGQNSLYNLSYFWADIHQISDTCRGHLVVLNTLFPFGQNPPPRQI